MVQLALASPGARGIPITTGAAVQLFETAAHGPLCRLQLSTGRFSGRALVEVHLSNPQDREDFRHFSYIETIAEKAFVGQGLQGYVSAIDYLSTVLQ